MIYNGYTQAELDALLQLLEELQIPHALAADEQMVQQTTAADKGQRRGSLNASYMRLEIEDSVLQGIDQKHYRALERFHIYPQYLDHPSELDFAAAAPEATEKKPAKPANRFIQVIMIIITGMMVYAAFNRR